MKVAFADSFLESLEKLAWHESKPYKFYSFFRYDTPRFLKNVWLFRKALYNYYWFDQHGVLKFMETGFDDMAANSEKRGYEIRESKEKKIEKMRRAAQLIRNYNEDNYIDQAEEKLGKLVLHEWEFEPSLDHPGSYQLIDKDTPEEKEHNSKVFALAREIGEAEWTELIEILRGQDYSKFKTEPDESDPDKSWDYWQSQFDGSGLRSWWD